ncbi:hypothetical protein Poli38472_014432 [Pythium oligandrum]|uniref:Uncharacterized protein n=1 Tax=Pythium oligandrum TaxID=41045 RepID=A0A8K1C7D9_PYTOL|nr:hypothetical protein Poli38472_014432 [Pythium oligandrum]|eukprot:TMW57829.1 hypothetical protein Poli38472_014432 [Pythium oligandrum]
MVFEAQTLIAAEDTSTVENRTRGPDLEIQRSVEYKRQQNAVADRLRRKLERQREAERAASQTGAPKLTRDLPSSAQAKPASEVTETQATKSKKKKNKKKKNKTQQGNIGQLTEDDVSGQNSVGKSTDTLQQFLSGNGMAVKKEEEEDDPVDELADALTALKMQDSAIEDARLTEVIKIIDGLGSRVKLYS